MTKRQEYRFSFVRVTAVMEIIQLFKVCNIVTLTSLEATIELDLKQQRDPSLALAMHRPTFVQSCSQPDSAPPFTHWANQHLPLCHNHTKNTRQHLADNRRRATDWELFVSRPHVLTWGRILAAVNEQETKDWLSCLQKQFPLYKKMGFLVVGSTKSRVANRP